MVKSFMRRNAFKAKRRSPASQIAGRASRTHEPATERLKA